MDSQKWSQKGKKLFLPKIEYNRLENSTETWNTAKMNSDSSDEFAAQESVENDELETSSSPVADLSERNGVCFTKFSVLPPINGSKASSKAGRLNQNRKEFSDNVVSGQGGLYHKRNGSSLYRQTAVLTRDRGPITLQKTNMDNPLKILGKRQSGFNNTRDQQQTIAGDDISRGGSGNATSRPSTTPNASQPFVSGAKSSRPFSDSENDNYWLTASPGFIPQGDRSGGRINSRRLAKFRRFNSDTSNEGKHENLEDPHTDKNTHCLPLSRANLPQSNFLLNPSGNCLGGIEKGVFISNCRSPRPISRCHIDINMNESENVNLNFKEAREVRSPDTSEHLFDTTLSVDVPSSSAPLIQVSTEQNSSIHERRDSHNPPSIQILINSLDSAKEEGSQDDKTEQPKLSVREQRRRSALCRANSKQVDDFLLVHNLRDLGLL